MKNFVIERSLIVYGAETLSRGPQGRVDTAVRWLILQHTNFNEQGKENLSHYATNGSFVMRIMWKSTAVE
jgi:hypothetical protein